MDFTFMRITLSDGHGGSYKLKLNKTAGTWMDDDPVNNDLSSVTMGGNCSTSGGAINCSGGGAYNVLSLKGANWGMSIPASGGAIHQRDPGGAVETNWTWTLDSITTEPIAGEYYPPGAGAVGCFGENTLVMMADGTQLPISKIARGDSIRALDQERGHSFSTKVVEVQQTRITKSYVIGLDNGQELEASPLQKLSTSAGPVDVAKLRIGAKVVAGDQAAGEVMNIRRVVGNIILFHLKLEAAADYLVGPQSALAAARQKN